MRAFVLAALLLPAVAHAEPPKLEETVVAADFGLRHCVEAYVATSAGKKLATSPEGLAVILMRGGLDFIRLKPTMKKGLMGALHELAMTKGVWNKAAWPPPGYANDVKLGDLRRLDSCRVVRQASCSWVLKAPDNTEAIVAGGKPALVAAVVTVYYHGPRAVPGPENCKLHGGKWTPRKR